MGVIEEVTIPITGITIVSVCRIHNCDRATLRAFEIIVVGTALVVDFDSCIGDMIGRVLTARTMGSKIVNIVKILRCVIIIIVIVNGNIRVNCLMERIIVVTRSMIVNPHLTGDVIELIIVCSTRVINNDICIRIRSKICCFGSVEIIIVRIIAIAVIGNFNCIIS